MSGLRRDTLLLFFAGLAMVALAGWIQRAPGYMDADYYFSGGLVIRESGGLNHPFLWNYLDEPKGLPVPASTYWMPMAALLSAVGMVLGGTFNNARIPFWLLAAAVPPITLRMGMTLHGDRRKALLGSLFALFPTYYLAYMPTTDVFAVYMLLGTGVLILVRNRPDSPLRWVALGLLCGLMHLTRADGILWLAGSLFLAIWPVFRMLFSWRKPVNEMWLSAGVAVLAVLGGYFLPMSFWYARNIQEWRWFFPPGSSRTLWLTRYEDTFMFPAELLSPQRWLAAGLSAILKVRGTALWINFQTILAVQGSVVLMPFALLGFWLLRRLLSVRFGFWMWMATFFSMTIIFPFAGINGSFFHSGAAFQPLIWAVVPVGIETAIDWIAVKRGWQKGKKVLRFVEVLLVTVCALLTLMLYYQRVAGVETGGIAWNRSDADYRAIETRLIELGATPCLTVMVNNPPGYFGVSHRPSVVIPFGDEEMVVKVAEQFGVNYMVLEENDAGHLPRLYDEPGNYPGLKYLGDVEGMKIYAFTESP